jgi:hypothetical protein
LSSFLDFLNSVPDLLLLVRLGVIAGLSADRDGATILKVHEFAMQSLPPGDLVESRLGQVFNQFPDFPGQRQILVF